METVVYKVAGRKAPDLLTIILTRYLSALLVQWGYKGGIQHILLHAAGAIFASPLFGAAMTLFSIYSAAKMIAMAVEILKELQDGASANECLKKLPADKQRAVLELFRLESEKAGPNSRNQIFGETKPSFRQNRVDGLYSFNDVRMAEWFHSNYKEIASIYSKNTFKRLQTKLKSSAENRFCQYLVKMVIEECCTRMVQVHEGRTAIQSSIKVNLFQLIRKLVDLKWDDDEGESTELSTEFRVTKMLRFRYCYATEKLKNATLAEKDEWRVFNGSKFGENCNYPCVQEIGYLEGDTDIYKRDLGLDEIEDVLDEDMKSTLEELTDKSLCKCKRKMDFSENMDLELSLSFFTEDYGTEGPCDHRCLLNSSGKMASFKFNFFLGTAQLEVISKLFGKGWALRLSLAFDLEIIFEHYFIEKAQHQTCRSYETDHEKPSLKQVKSNVCSYRCMEDTTSMSIS